MNRTFKVVARDRKTKLQIKKRVYTSKEDFDKYSPELKYRYINYCKWDVESYELIKGVWEELL